MQMMGLVLIFVIFEFVAAFGFSTLPRIDLVHKSASGKAIDLDVLRKSDIRGKWHMKVVGVSHSRMLQIIPRKVTPEQVAAFWGVNPKERLQRILESLLVSYGGAWAAWFLSFMAGGYVAAFVGTILIFNWMYTPWVNARRRNSKMWPSTDKKIYYAVFMGRIKQLKKVKRRAGKSIGAVAQEYLLMLVKDEKGRELEVVTLWQPSYSQLRKDMRCDTIISSFSRDFESVFMIADLWAPACDVWIGDYPYITRQPFKLMLQEIGSRLSSKGMSIPDIDETLNDEDDGNNKSESDVEGDGPSSGDDSLLRRWIARAKQNGKLSPDFEVDQAIKEDGDNDYYPSDVRASSRFVTNTAPVRRRPMIRKR